MAYHEPQKMTSYKSMLDAHAFARSPEGSADINGSLEGEFYNDDLGTVELYDTPRAAILAQLASMSEEDVRDAKRGWGVAGVKRGGEASFTARARARNNNAYLTVEEGGALDLLNDTQNFTEDDAFGAPVDFHRA